MPAKSPSINLLGDQNLDHTPIGRIVSWAVTYGRYIMIGTEIVVLLAFISRFSLDRKLTDLKEELTQKQAIIEANLDFEGDVRALQDKLTKAKKILQTETDPVATLTLIQSLLPADVHLENLGVENGTIHAEAVAGTTEGFSQFLSSMQNTKELQKVEFSDISRDPLNGIRFSLSAVIAPKGITPLK